MNKKKILFSSLIIVFLAVIYTFSVSRNLHKTITENLPLIPSPAKSYTKPTITQKKIIPIPTTKIESITNQLDPVQSKTEIEKIVSLLPIYIKNFPTSTGTKSTINVYISENDTGSMLRIEILGPNYNNPNINGKDATIFKESFLNVKNFFNLHKVDLKKIQIVYGSRQHIQDTASNWVKIFSLLD